KWSCLPIQGGAMSSPDETRATEWRTASRFYRRPPGLGWLAGLVAIPLLLGAIGYLTLPKTHVSAPSVAAPSVAPSVAAPSLAPSLAAPSVSVPSLPNATVNAPNVNAPLGAGASCANLGADVAGLLQTPINFDTDSYTLSASDQQELTQVADRLKACPNANV